jgi:hypothetical protein
MFVWIVVPKNIVAKTNVQGTKKFLQSHVVTFNQYLNIMQQKAIEKEIKKTIKQN